MANLVPYSRNTDLFNLMDDMFNDTWMLRTPFANTFKVDVKEDDASYTIEAEMPGVDKKDISVDIEDGRLTIAVNQDETTKVEEEGYIHRERRTTSMTRSIYLDSAGEKGVTAKLENGLLNIHIPKAKNVKKDKKITVE